MRPNPSRTQERGAAAAEQLGLTQPDQHVGELCRHRDEREVGACVRRTGPKLLLV